MAYLWALITLFAIVILVISVIRITILTVRYLKWRRIGVPAVGIVGEVQNVTYVYNRNDDIIAYQFHYALKIICHGQEFDNVYTEERKPGKAPMNGTGSRINILWSANDHKYLQIAKTGREIWQMVKREAAFILHVALLIFGNKRYFREHHRSVR